MSNCSDLGASTGGTPDVSKDDLPTGPRLGDKDTWCQMWQIWGEKPQSMAVFGKIRCSFSFDSTLCGSNVSGEREMQDWSGEGKQWRVQTFTQLV